MIYSEAFFLYYFHFDLYGTQNFFFFFANDTTPVVYNLFSAVENAENLFLKDCFLTVLLFTVLILNYPSRIIYNFLAMLFLLHKQ